MIDWYCYNRLSGTTITDRKTEGQRETEIERYRQSNRKGDRDCNGDRFV